LNSPFLTLQCLGPDLLRVTTDVDVTFGRFQVQSDIGMVKIQK